jgi:hypothetical protein
VFAGEPFDSPTTAAPTPRRAALGSTASIGGTITGMLLMIVAGSEGMSDDGSG